MAKKKTKKKPRKAPISAVAPSPAPGKDKKGCAISFLMEERGEMNPLCERTPEEMKDEYVQPDKEKEDGGEA